MRAVVQVVTAQVPLAVAAVAAATRLRLPSTARTTTLERTSARNWSYHDDCITSWRSASAEAAQSWGNVNGRHRMRLALEALELMPRLPLRAFTHAQHVQRKVARTEAHGRDEVCAIDDGRHIAAARLRKL